MCAPRPAPSLLRSFELTIIDDGRRSTHFPPLTPFILSRYLFPQLSSDMAQSLNAVEAHRLQATVAQHFCDLCVLLLVLLEDQLTLLGLILVLSATTILSSLSFILRHCG